MKKIDFNPFGNKSLSIQFICTQCGNSVKSDEIAIPYPDYSSDTAHDSQVNEQSRLICETCERQYDVSLFVTYAGGYGTIENLPDNYQIELTEYPEQYYKDQFDAISSNVGFHDTFLLEIKNLKNLNKLRISEQSVYQTLKRQIFIGIIASLETYLCDAFIITTLSSEDFTKKFVSTFHEFQNKTIRLSEIFDYHEKINILCRQSMLQVIYHNLPKVKCMYKDTLNIDLGNISEANKAINTRHDLVHRNGKTKEGKEVSIDKGTIDKLFHDIEAFVENIEKQIIYISNDYILPF